MPPCPNPEPLQPIRRTVTPQNLMNGHIRARHLPAHIFQMTSRQGSQAFNKGSQGFNKTQPAKKRCRSIDVVRKVLAVALSIDPL